MSDLKTMINDVLKKAPYVSDVDIDSIPSDLNDIKKQLNMQSKHNTYEFRFGFVNKNNENDSEYINETKSKSGNKIELF